MPRAVTLILLILRRLRRLPRLALPLLLVLCLAWPGLALAAGRFLALSDVHLDPFADPALVAELVAAPAEQWPAILARGQAGLGAYGRETSQALLESALADMALVEPRPDFIIFTGDLLAHHFGRTYQRLSKDDSQAGLEAFIAKTMSVFAATLAKRFPGVEVHLTLGNNDAYEGDYLVAPGGHFLRDATDVFAARFFPEPSRRADFARQFPAAGHYALPLAGPGKLRLVSLNGVYFSHRHPDSDREGGPWAAELDWLEAELARAEAAGERVLLLAHIPPGVNVYNTLRDPANNPGALERVQGFWSPRPQARFLEILARHERTVAAIFSGHTHMDDFRLLRRADGQAAVYVGITPALSPQFGNNPGFKVFSYDAAAGRLLDFQTHYLDLAASQPVWRGEYGFLQAYGQVPGVGGVEPASGLALWRALAGDARARGLFTTHYRVSNRISPYNQAEFAAYWCAIAHMDPAAYAQCHACLVRGEKEGGAAACAR